MTDVAPNDARRPGRSAKRTGRASSGRGEPPSPGSASHGFTPKSATFDDQNLVSLAGLVPVMALAEQTKLSTLQAGRALPQPGQRVDEFEPAMKLRCTQLEFESRLSESRTDASEDRDHTEAITLMRQAYELTSRAGDYWLRARGITGRMCANVTWKQAHKNADSAILATAESLIDEAVEINKGTNLGHAQMVYAKV